MKYFNDVGIIEEVIQKNYFQNLKFVDLREKEVFLSYIKGFLPLIFDQKVRNVLEIGGGQSTYLLAFLSKTANFNLTTIDMNPSAIKNKLRSLSMSDDVIKSINFVNGFSISSDLISEFYKNKSLKIANIPYKDLINKANKFINTSMDNRKLEKVLNALEIKKYNKEKLLEKLFENDFIPNNLINIYRDKDDEFEFKISKKNAYLKNCIEELNPEVVFLDGGEFSSLVEWELVYQYQKKGAYVILHDIFFPKSIKNWLVAASISASKKYEILYCDETNPQGFLVAQRKIS